MTDYTNIVNDLLGINDTMFAISTSNINIDKISIRMAFDKNWHNIAEHAAAAIEALQDTVQAQDKALKECARQLAKMGPKRGEWVREMNVYDEPFYHCSACGECFDSNRDDTYGIFNYCPNCGAKMREVQDG